MARQPSVGHTEGIREPQQPQEGEDVEPQPRR